MLAFEETNKNQLKNKTKDENYGKQNTSLLEKGTLGKVAQISGQEGFLTLNPAVRHPPSQSQEPPDCLGPHRGAGSSPLSTWHGPDRLRTRALCRLAGPQGRGAGRDRLTQDLKDQTVPRLWGAERKGCCTHRVPQEVNSRPL